MAILAGYMEWILTPAETDGHYWMLETFIPPGAGVPPHQRAESRGVDIVERTLEVACLGSGGLGVVPSHSRRLNPRASNEIHGFRNASTFNTRTLVTATAGIGAFFEESGIPIAPGTSPPTGPPALADIGRLLTIARKHGHRFARGQSRGRLRCFLMVDLLASFSAACYCVNWRYSSFACLRTGISGSAFCHSLRKSL